MFKRSPQKARDVRESYPLRVMAMLVVFCLHLAVLWGEGIIPVWFWIFVFVHTLLAPHLVYFFSYTRQHEQAQLLFDVFMYAVYVGTWGFNPFLIAVFISTSNWTLISLGGGKKIIYSVAVICLGGFLGGSISGFYFRPQIDALAMFIAAIGLFIFMLGFGFITYNVNQSLHNARREIRARHEELTDINNLAAAVNSELDIDSIIRRLLAALGRHFELEAIYFLAHKEKENKLCMAGIYGEAISFSELSQYDHIEYDYERDVDSVFVMGLKQRRIINISHLTPEMVAKGCEIDRRLYNIKPSVSIAYFPVYIDDSVVGGLAFINHKVSFELTKKDLKRISDYLIQVGTAIKNAKLIAELTKAKEDALLAQKKAEESEEAKSRFLANMSHEIRTPMSAILGYSEALQEPDISVADRKQFVEIIMSSGSHLLSMINDILDISKIEASKVQIEKITIDLVSLLMEIESYLKLKCAEKGLNYSIAINYPVPQILINDSTRLKQVLFNLCNNAIKFTAKGSIDLVVSWPSASLILFTVRDTGIGMTPAECGRIFDAFTQADTSTTRLYGGTGLGLTISKNLAILMGGNIEVFSEKGIGSQFDLSVDAGDSTDQLIDSSCKWDMLKAQRAVEEHRLTTPKLLGRVLIAEDNPINQQIIERLIAQTGLQIDLVDDGQKAVEQATRERYDLILLDIQMPVMGGVEAAKKMIAAGQTTPLIAFTANVMTHQIEDYFKAGFMDVIEKPINKQKLYALLTQLLPSQTSQLNTVLVVDDDDVSGMILGRQIKKFNGSITVLIAKNGQEAIATINNAITTINNSLATINNAKTTLNNATATINNNAVDLVFMDMEMPVMGGLETTEKLRQMGFDKPIYIVTGNADQEHKNLCLSAGATGHLTKPLDKSTMRGILQKY